MTGPSLLSQNQSFAKRLSEVSPSSTLALTAKAKALKSEGYPVISLAAGEPDFATPETVQKAIVNALQEGKTRYTPTSGLVTLKKAVAEKLARDNGIHATEKNVVISCGAKHSLYNLIQALINEGDEVILPKPYWVSYPEMVRLAGGIPVYVETANNNYVMTAKAIEAAITPKTKLICLNSPSNPTGAVIPASELQEIANLIQSKNLFCISDEIYEYYVYDGEKHTSIASLIPNWMEYVAIVNGVSKSYSMTGLRIGYTICHEELAKKMGILQDHSTSNPTSISQDGAIEALNLAGSYIENLKKEFEERRNLVVSLLEEITVFDVEVPRGAFYVFASIKKTGLKPDKFCNRLLEEAHVAVIPGEGFGSEDGIRLSFATSRENIQEGIKRISNWIQNQK